MEDEVERELQLLQMAVTLDPSEATDRTVRDCLLRLHTLRARRPQDFGPERLQRIEVCRSRWEAVCTPERLRPPDSAAPPGRQADDLQECQHCGCKTTDLKPYTYTSRYRVGHPIYGSDHTYSSTSMLCPQCLAAATRFSVTEFLSEHPLLVVMALAMTLAAVIGWLAN